MAVEEPVLVARCDLRYLRARAFAESFALILIAIGLMSLHFLLGLLGSVVAVAIVWFNFHVRRMDRYTVYPNELHTKKLFTDQVDVSTAMERVQSVSVHQGILEVQFGAGSVMITTAATDPKQAEIIWRHVAQPDSVAQAIRMRVASGETAYQRVSTPEISR